MGYYWAGDTTLGHRNRLRDSLVGFGQKKCSDISPYRQPPPVSGPSPRCVFFACLFSLPIWVGVLWLVL